MSYILEALKKAERERGVKQVPMLLTVHYSSGIRSNYRAAIVGGLLVCSAAAVWFLLTEWTGFHQPPTPAAASAEQNRAMTERAGESTQMKAKSSPVTPLDAIAPLKAGDSRGIMVPAPGELWMGSREKTVQNSDALPKSLDDGRAAAQSSRNPIISPQGGSAPMNPLSAQKESPPILNADGQVAKEAIPPVGAAQATPASLHEAMAKMALNILVYHDDEAARKVYISGKKYLKGDLVDGFYLIESITPEGVILSYKGERALLR